ATRECRRWHARRSSTECASSAWAATTPSPTPGREAWLHPVTWIESSGWTSPPPASEKKPRGYFVNALETGSTLAATPTAPAGRLGTPQPNTHAATIALRAG